MPTRQLRPATTRRFEFARWEVTTDDGRVAGWVQEVHLRHAKNTFYRALGIYSPTGEVVDLELSIDFDERVQRVLGIFLDPWSQPEAHLYQLKGGVEAHRRRKAEAGF